MITADEYELLVNELLALEIELEKLGDIKVTTSEGVYYVYEQKLIGHQDQITYDRIDKECKQKRRIVEAFDMMARYRLAIASVIT